MNISAEKELWALSLHVAATAEKLIPAIEAWIREVCFKFNWHFWGNCFCFFNGFLSFFMYTLWFVIVLVARSCYVILLVTYLAHRAIRICVSVIPSTWRSMYILAYIICIQKNICMFQILYKYVTITAVGAVHQ